MNIGHSCYINSVFQCLSHIPALSRFLLETDLKYSFKPDTFLFYYIKLLQCLIPVEINLKPKQKLTEKVEKKLTSDLKKQHIKTLGQRLRQLTDKKSSINPKFATGDNDPGECLENLLEKFLSESSEFHI